MGQMKVFMCWLSMHIWRPYFRIDRSMGYARIKVSDDDLAWDASNAFSIPDNEWLREQIKTVQGDASTYGPYATRY